MFYLKLSFQLKKSFVRDVRKFRSFFWLPSVSSLRSSWFVAIAAEILFFSL